MTWEVTHLLEVALDFGAAVSEGEADRFVAGEEAAEISAST